MARVAIIGAGMAGLTAAGLLTDLGHRVVVLDKGRKPGGRMATRHLDGATFDHGAQFFTTKTDWFRDVVARWQQQGVATTWFHGGPEASAADTTAEDGHPRFRGSAEMRMIPERLAADLDVRCATRVAALRHHDHGWEVRVADGASTMADAVLLTAPAPQVLDLLTAGGVRPDGELLLLRDVHYDPCWAALVVPDGTPDLPDHGALRLRDHPLHWISDNRRKGVSELPAVTLQASPARTEELFDVPAAEVGAHLLADAGDHVRGRVVRTHRWRYSAPLDVVTPTSLVHVGHAPLAVAGDGLAGGRVEGAAISGRDAAQRLHEHLA